MGTLNPPFLGGDGRTLSRLSMACRKARTHSEAAMTDVLREFAALEQRVYHLIGNHCLYNFPRAELNARLGGCFFWRCCDHVFRGKVKG